MEAGKQVKKLPMSLGEALEALSKDEVIQSGMPGEMYRLYDEYKRDEWEEFMHTVTDWDQEKYMDILALARDIGGGPLCRPFIPTFANTGVTGSCVE